LKSESLKIQEPSGTIQACTGIALVFFTTQFSRQGDHVPGMCAPLLWTTFVPREYDVQFLKIFPESVSKPSNFYTYVHYHSVNQVKLSFP